MVANKERAIKRKASEGGAKPEPITSKQEPLDESNDEDNSNESDYESDKVWMGPRFGTAQKAAISLTASVECVFGYRLLFCCLVFAGKSTRKY